VKVKELYRKIRDGIIISDIELQRDIVYNDEKQSLVIDSIVKKIPLPAFYFWKNRNRKLEVLDGKQRIHAIKRFKENDIKYNNKLWQETSSSIQKKIDDTELVDIICKGPDKLKREIFRRINVLGVALNKYEVLNGLFHGRYLSELSQYVKDDRNISKILGANQRGKNQYEVLKKILILKGTDNKDSSVQKYVDENQKKTFQPDHRKVSKYINFVAAIFEKFNKFDIFFSLAQKYLNDKTIWQSKKDKINNAVQKYLKSDEAKITDQAKEIEDIILAAVNNIRTDPKRLFTKDDKKELLGNKTIIDGKYKCEKCNNKFLSNELTVDHKVPWSKGPPGTVISNAQLLCRPCNSRKGNKHFIED
tara:strand:+ start:599 stop:1684 length:1086 start_codon:yes stop_codon:yes gene_type:complete